MAAFYFNQLIGSLFTVFNYSFFPEKIFLPLLPNHLPGWPARARGARQNSGHSRGLSGTAGI